MRRSGRTHREAFHCQCGTSAVARSFPPDFARDVVARIRAEHEGPGHAPVSSEYAARIRRAQEKAGW